MQFKIVWVAHKNYLQYFYVNSKFIITQNHIRVRPNLEQ